MEIDYTQCDVLLVDDEPNVLDSYRRMLRKAFRIELANGPEAALQKIRDGKMFAVIVSDMMMPKMTGAELLSKVKTECPSTVGIMLTGNQDQETAATAINDAQVFTFLTKPCSNDVLETSIKKAIDHHRLLTLEKDLLENTVGGSIKLVLDVLAILDPTGFGQGKSLQKLVGNICDQLSLPNKWEIEMTAMLANIGSVVVPATIRRKILEGATLDPREEKTLASVPIVGSKLLKNVPRLETVAQCVACVENNFDGTGTPHDGLVGADIPLASRVVRLARDILEREYHGHSRLESMKLVFQQREVYDPELLADVIRLHCGLSEEELRAAKFVFSDTETIEVSAKELQPGQKVLSDIVSKDGLLLLAKGAVINELFYQRLRNFIESSGIEEPITVAVEVLEPPQNT